jgi:hypothetical protein
MGFVTCVILPLYVSFSDIESLGFVHLNCQILHECVVCIVWSVDVYFSA